MEIFRAGPWQMYLGERSALEGMLSALAPDLAIEIGTAEGGSLRRIATHAREVHSFDLVEPSLDLPEHVTLHTGDSHELLPRLLARLAEEGRNVDFVMVDGDHSSEGVRRDLEDLLDSPAVARTVIVMHDTANEVVRRGLEDVPYEIYGKVAYVELDWVTGYLFNSEELHHELWGGLGLVVVDAEGAFGIPPEWRTLRWYPQGQLLAFARSQLEAGPAEPAGATAQSGLEARVAALELQVDELRRLVAG